jgi:pimeloyl-ACP methyl ester carboxylesterase
MTTGTGKRTSSDGISISYTTHNLSVSQTSRPVLCFVHGWCCSSALWAAQASLLGHHPSVLIDLPGHGESDKPDNVEYGMEFFAKSIHAVLEAEAVSQVVLIGHSMGGCIATMFLRLYGEEMVKGIVYVSSFWQMPAHYLTHDQRHGWAASLKDDENVMGLFESAWTGKSSQRIIDRVRETMCRLTPMHVRLGATTTDALPPHWRWDEVFARIPMLQITYKDAPEWDEQHRRHLPNLTTERWADVSVFLFMEDAEKFNERVERFLRDNQLC